MYAWANGWPGPGWLAGWGASFTPSQLSAGRPQSWPGTCCSSACPRIKLSLGCPLGRNPSLLWPSSLAPRPPNSMAVRALWHAQGSRWCCPVACVGRPWRSLTQRPQQDGAKGLPPRCGQRQHHQLHHARGQSKAQNALLARQREQRAQQEGLHHQPSGAKDHEDGSLVGHPEAQLELEVLNQQILRMGQLAGIRDR